MLRLEVIGSTCPRFVAVGTRYQFDALPVTVGRWPTNRLVLKGDSVSRHHARFELVDGRVVLTDLQSENGVAVNGVHGWGSYPLADGAEIVIGNFTLRVGLYLRSST